MNSKFRTNNQSEFFGVSAQSLVFDSKQTFIQELWCFDRSLSIHNNLPYLSEIIFDGASIWELTRFIDSDMSREERPMLMAVSCLSPVNTQIWHVSQSTFF